MSADILTEIPEKIFSQCGLVAVLLVVGILYLAAQLAKTRAGWEADRTRLMQVIGSQNTSYDNLALSNARLEGIMLAFQQRH